MLRNYLKTAIRVLWKERGYSLLNILGLAVGITSAIFITYYVVDELSYDRFHEKGDRIYRVVQSFKNGESYTTTALTPYRAAELLKEMSPAVADFCRVDNTLSGFDFEYMGVKYPENTGAFVDSNFFTFFSFPLIEGDPKRVLSEPNTMVISRSKARKYFGDDNPVGKTLKASSGFDGDMFEVTITGLMEDMPANSHFHYDFLIAKSTGDAYTPGKIDSWGWTSVFSYIELAPGYSIGEVEALFPDLQKKHSPDWFQKWAYFSTQPMLDIHLYSHLKDEREANSSISYIYIFSSIGFLILLIACINYLNLATARAIRRAREVGMRKVVGARRRQLIFQFISESFLMVGLSFIMALLLVELGKPLFFKLTEKSLSFSYFYQPAMITTVAGALLVTGLLAGLYPAFFLSSFRPASVLSGTFSRVGRQALLLRKGLVVLQFGISIALIIGMMVVYEQWQYLRNKNLGIDSEQMVLMPVLSQRMLDQFAVFKSEALSFPGVNKVTASSKDPLDVFSNYNSFAVSGLAEEVTLPGVRVDEDFFDAYNVDLISGQDFRAYLNDSADVIIINEAAARLLQKEDPVGMTLRYGEENSSRIIGVVEDFHFESLYSEIRPMYFYHGPGYMQTISAVLEPGRIDESLAYLEKTWQGIDLEEPFTFQFLDQAIERQYRAEGHFLSVFLVFSALAILIACLGIFGLSAYSVSQRKKEIGVRKVLGATTGQITGLLSGEFLKLVAWAFVIAAPAAGLIMDRWLDQFAYQISITPVIFLFAGIAALTVAWLAVCYNAIRAAVADPVNSLKYE